MFELISSITTDKYIVSIYRLALEEIYPSPEELVSLHPELNKAEYPSQIVQIIETLRGVSKIEVFDINHNLLVSSSLLGIVT